MGSTFEKLMKSIDDIKSNKTTHIAFDMASGKTGAERTVFHTRPKLTYSGMQIIQSVLATEEVEDWSNVRSPSRARRRLKQGHKQNVVTRQRPAAFMYEGTLIVHPEYYREISKRMVDSIERRMLKNAFGDTHPHTGEKE